MMLVAESSCRGSTIKSSWVPMLLCASHSSLALGPQGILLLQLGGGGGAPAAGTPQVGADHHRRLGRAPWQLNTADVLRRQPRPLHLATPVSAFVCWLIIRDENFPPPVGWRYPTILGSDLSSSLLYRGMRISRHQVAVSHLFRFWCVLVLAIYRDENFPPPVSQW